MVVWQSKLALSTPRIQNRMSDVLDPPSLGLQTVHSTVACSILSVFAVLIRSFWRIGRFRAARHQACGSSSWLGSSHMAAFMQNAHAVCDAIQVLPLPPGK